MKSYPQTMKRIFLPIISVVIVTLLTCCGNEVDTVRDSTATDVQARCDTLWSYIRNNRFRLPEVSDTALSYLNEIIGMDSTLLTESQRDNQMMSYKLAAGIHIASGRMEDGFQMYMDGADAAHASGDKEYEFGHNLSLFYITSAFRMDNLTDDYRRRCLDLMKFQKDSSNIVQGLAITAGSFMNEHKLDSALKYIDMAVGFVKSDTAVWNALLPEARYLFRYINGWIYSSASDSTDAAMAVLEPLYEELRHTPSFPSHDVTTYCLARTCENMGDSARAGRLYDEALEIVTDKPTIINFDVVTWLMKKYIADNDVKRQMALLPVYDRLSDMFHANRNASLFSMYNAMFRMNEKKAEIARQQQEIRANRLLIALLSAVVLILVGLCVWGVMFWRGRKRKLRTLFEAMIQRQLLWHEMMMNVRELSPVLPQQISQGDTNNNTTYDKTTTDYESTMTGNDENDATMEQMKNLYHRLLSVMEVEKPFVNPKLTLNDVALLVGTHRSRLSNTINQITRQNFSTWLASYRVNYLLELYMAADDATLPMEHFLEQAGFASRSTFYRLFKQITGLTPNQFRQQLNLKK